MEFFRRFHHHRKMYCYYPEFQWRVLMSNSLSAELTKGINYRVIGMLQIYEMIQREISKVITLNEFKALISGPLKQPLQLRR